MFHVDNVKPQVVLNKTHSTTSNTQEEIWLTSEQDALHIPLISTELNNGTPENQYNPNLLNPFGVYIADTKKKNIDSIQKVSPINNNQNKFIVGVYTPNKETSLSLQKILSQHPELTMQYFDATLSDDEFKTKTENIKSFSMWIVNLSDDDESSLLDCVLNSSADSSTLFLSGALSTRCKQKINDFIKVNCTH